MTRLLRRDALAFFLVLITLAAACNADQRPRDEDRLMPPDVPTAYSDDGALELLKRYLIDDGAGVDYEAWQSNADDVATLQGQIDLFAKVSPDSH
ncbi:MAG: hypothetical protein AAFX85_16530, partial [Pseudomonadota bacterium]